MAKMLAMSEESLDLIIVGAGISGIGMAAHYKARLPGKRFVLLERRERLGGTWDLFRYPGVRSDSDMYTLGFGFAPWREREAIARGETILAYLDRVADGHGLREHMRFGQAVVSADWDGAAGLWTVTTAGGGTLSGRFLYMGSGYYDYDEPHDARIPGLSTFAGPVLHPQFWREDVDLAGKRVVVVGSGATAVTMVPAMARAGAQVIMLQRTPSWLFKRPTNDPLAGALRRVLPGRWVSGLMRAFNVRMQAWLYAKCRTQPEEMAAYFTDELRKELGDAYDGQAFTPPYKPWDQRLCVVPDGDFFQAVKDGGAEVVTGTIETVDETGVLLHDGRHLPADILVPATGLRLCLMGKIAVRIDGEPVNFAEHFSYRSCMFSNVPNFAALFGYLNAGWTLRVDIVADWLCRLLEHMDLWDRQVATPYLSADHGLVENDPVAAYSSGYLQRARDLLPRSSTTAPWRIGLDYGEDRRELRNASIDDGVLRFERVAHPLPA